MKHFIRQDSPSSCGFACARMMLSRYLKSDRYLYEEKAEICHFLDLQRYLDAYGVRTEGVRFRNLNELKKHRFSVVQIQNPNSTHFVIYRRTRGKSVFLLDPQSGERVLNEGDFAAIFTGYALIEVGTEKKRRKPPVRRIAFGYDVLYFFSLLVDFVLLYAINLHLSETILISGLIAAVFVNFLGKFLLNFGMFRTLDRKYVLPFIDAGATYEEVGELSRWKSEEIRFRSRKIVYGSLTAFLVAFLIYGNPAHLFLIAFLGLTLGLKRGFLNPSLKRIEESAARVEREESDQPGRAYRKIVRFSGKYARNRILFSVGSLFFGSLTLGLLYDPITSFSTFWTSSMLTLSLYECGNRFFTIAFREIDELKFTRYAFYRLQKKYRK